MTPLRTALVALLLGLTTLPALAEGFAIDLPRLEFPADAQVTRGASTSVVLPAYGN